MSRDPSGEFNARFLTPEGVARQFVPTREYYKLTHPRHSVLIGPRGCGKTTLLKMLTRRALATWRKEREPAGGRVLDVPPFEAIYIPTDVRWSYELAKIGVMAESAADAGLLQRAITSAAVMQASLDVFTDLLRGDVAVSRRVCEGLVTAWGLDGTLPLWNAIQQRLDGVASTVAGLVNLNDSRAANTFLHRLPPCWLGYSLDAAVMACKVFQREAPRFNESGKWALCVDELELAPEWLRREVFESLRSANQDFYLKLTASPLLPSGLKSTPQSLDDYHKIRLWKSHVDDARQFCEDLTCAFLKGKLGSDAPAADVLFGPSLLTGSDDGALGGAFDAYGRGGVVYEAMRDLAIWDRSFRSVAITRGLDPGDPFSDTADVRDTFFRKVRSTVLLRQAFRRGERGRSRKVRHVYSGKGVIFSMSDGNPRWLSWLLSELCDAWLLRRERTDMNALQLPLELQARILLSVSRRFRSRFSAVPSTAALFAHSDEAALGDVLDLIGEWLSESILRGPFSLDPYGSVEVDVQVPPGLLKTLAQGAERGALIFVGADEDEVPESPMGARLRPSFMLSPRYKLALRNHKSVPLSRILSAQGQLYHSRSGHGGR